MTPAGPEGFRAGSGGAGVGGGDLTDLLSDLATRQAGKGVDARTFVAIQSVAALYGHVIDARRWELLEFVYTDDGVYDGTLTGSSRHAGRAAIVRYLSTSSQPSAHHVSNLLLVSEDAGIVVGLSKYFVVRPDMSIASGFYRDKWCHTKGGWRIQERASHQLSTATKA